ncbi:MAG: hypothetical protein ACOCNB_06875 [Acetivibrio ethanolgignens]
MESVRKFDAMLKEKESETFTIAAAVMWILVLPMVIMMTFPFEAKELGITHLMVIYIIGMALIMYLQPYMYIKENGKVRKIYAVLEEMPVTWKDIYRVRREYLDKFCLRTGVVFVACQLLTALLRGKWTIFVVLHPLFVMGIVWFFGLSYIWNWRK